MLANSKTAYILFYYRTLGLFFFCKVGGKGLSEVHKRFVLPRTTATFIDLEIHCQPLRSEFLEGGSVGWEEGRNHAVQPHYANFP